MPTTKAPNLSPVKQPSWQNGTNIDGFFGLKRVTSKDEIKYTDVNELRQWIELLATHTHEYVDYVGGC